MSHFSRPRRFILLIIFIWVLLIGVDRLGYTFLPLEAYYFRPWEYMLGSHRFGVRRTNETATMKSYGDLGNMLGDPSYLDKRTITFTLDQDGYRNPQELRHIFPDILVVGNSFMAGAGNTDVDTFSVQLQDQIDHNVSAAAPENISTVLADTTINPQLVIWGRAERNLTNRDPEIQKLLSDESCFQEKAINDRVIEKFKSAVKHSLKDSWEFIRLSPVRRFSQNLYRRVRFMITKTHHPGVVVSGHQLFLKKGLNIYEENPETKNFNQVANAIAHVRDCLSARQIDFLFIPIPDKPHTILGSKFDPDPLDVLSEELRKLDVAHVHLWPAFRDSTSKLYWSDDTHWNGEGISLVVGETVYMLENMSW